MNEPLRQIHPGFGGVGFRAGREERKTRGPDASFAAGEVLHLLLAQLVGVVTPGAIGVGADLVLGRVVSAENSRVGHVESPS
ncbi:hypothetical protein [Mycobacterium simulans]|uniref:hypothetical protein n=1 Tax=Mycobacterium simulans TaxID=627089 RepID=UPI00174E0A03|nr:hypothetical protein [Mycobacterium simulans]